MSIKKIVFFTVSLKKGGAERVISILSNYLIEDYYVTIFLLNKEIEFELDSRINVIVIDFSFYNFVFSLFKLNKLIYEYKVDKIITFLYKPSFITILAKNLFQWKVSIVVSERTYTLSHYGKNTIKGFIGIFLIKYFYNRADLILPNSKLTGSALKEKLYINTPIKVIYNPIVLPENVEIKDQFGKVVQILTVGNFFSYKNQEMLIRGLEFLDFKDWHLNLIGDGPMMENLIDLTKELNIQDKVSFLGSVDARLFYSHSDIFVLPSLIEGFPNALVEAMSFGLPVISTDCKSGPREILCPNTDFRVQLQEGCDPEYGEFGILVPCSNFIVLSKALKRLLSERQLYKFYNTQSLQRAKDFSHNKILNEFKLTINDTFHK